MIGLDIITSNLDIGMDVIIVLLLTCMSIPFGAKSLDLLLMVFIVLMALCSFAFFYWDSSWDYTLPIKLMFGAIVLLALTLRSRVAGELPQ